MMIAPRRWAFCNGRFAPVVGDHISSCVKDKGVEGVGGEGVRTVDMPELRDHVVVDLVVLDHDPHHLFETGEFGEGGVVGESVCGTG